MLDVQVSHFLPHALKDPYSSVPSWALHTDGAISSSSSASHSGRQGLEHGDLNGRLSVEGRGVTMSEGLTAYRDGMNAAAFMSGSGLASMSSHAASYQPAYLAPTTDTSQRPAATGATSSVDQHSKSPDSQRSYATQSETSSQTKVSSTLLIPDTLKVPQRDLSQLAAEVACLFWFEPGTVINMIERSNSGANSPLLPLSPSAISANITPSESFRKWLTGLLQTTQVTQNVIILALLFIHRLKRKNPGVVANPGSEFRLMTVALMLGNKFLDDNTYTNKTWADVSGISVHEIHTMEVEFLSNMRYSLFTTKAQWFTWHDMLTKFGRAVHDFIKTQEAAAKLALMAPLQSPKKSLSPTFGYYHNGSLFNGHDLHSQTPVLLPQSSSTAISPIGSLPELSHSSGSRKRFRDDISVAPPAKRRMPDMLSASNLPPMVTMPPTASHSDMARLHLPSLTIPGQNTHLPPMHGLPAPNERAMAMVYPQVQQRAPVSHQMMVPPIQTSNLTPSSYTTLDPQRQVTGYPISAASSPISANPHTSHMSPSYFLSQRSSPYRPVRQVKTLLNPPRAPTSIYSAPRQVSMDHLQYHRLGQPLNERHIGHVPYFQREAWPQSYQPRQWPQTMGMQGSYVHPQS